MVDKASSPEEYKRVPDWQIEADPHEIDDRPMTDPQRSYLQTLTSEAGEPFEEELSVAEALRRIDELQLKTGRLRD